MIAFDNELLRKRDDGDCVLTRNVADQLIDVASPLDPEISASRRLDLLVRDAVSRPPRALDAESVRDRIVEILGAAIAEMENRLLE